MAFVLVMHRFVPDEQLISASQLAALRGVDVRILIPENPDQMLVYLSSFSYLEVEEMLDTDFRASRQVLSEEYTNRSLPFRFSVRAARLLAPVQ